MNRFVEIPGWLVDSWMFPWLRLHLFTRALLTAPADAATSATVKAALQRAVDLRNVMMRARWLN